MTDPELDFRVDEELQQLADDFLRHAELPAAHVDAAYDAVANQLATASTASAAGGAAASNATKWAVGLALIGALGGAAWLTKSEPAPPASAAVPQLAAPLAPAPAPSPAPETAVPVQVEAVAPVPAAELERPPLASDAVPRKAPTPAPSPASASTSRPSKAATTTDEHAPEADPVADAGASGARAELLLLERARQAMRRGDARTTLELLDEHARRFPKGRFDRERDATRVSALCRAGMESRARQAAADFVERYGNERAGFDPDEPCRR